MRIRCAVLLVAVAVCAACTRYSEPPRLLTGKFRSAVPITAKERKPPLYWQYHFSETGMVVLSIVEESGAINNRPTEELRYVMEGRIIDIQPLKPTNGLFCASDLTFVNADRLLIADGDMCWFE